MVIDPYSNYSIIYILEVKQIIEDSEVFLECKVSLARNESISFLHYELSSSPKINRYRHLNFTGFIQMQY